MPFGIIKKVVKKVTGGVKKVASSVAKGAKKTIKAVGNIAEKAVKGVAKGVREVGRGVRKLAKNKYVRLGLMITAAVMLPGAIAALPAISALGTTAAAVATGAITGAVTGAGSTLLAGGDLKDALKTGALGAATGAAFARIGQAIKGAQATTSAEATGALDDVSKTVDDVAGTFRVENVPDLATDTGSLFDLEKIQSASVTDGTFKVTSPLDVSRGLDISPDVLRDPSSFVNVPETKLTARGTRTVLSSSTGMSEQVAQSLQDFKLDTSALTDAQRNALGLPEVISPTEINIPESQSFGDRVKDSIKDTFSPENLVSAGGDLLVGAAQTALQQRLQGDPENVGAYGMRPETVGPSLLEQFQLAYRNADINILDAYQNMTYGSGDINSAGSELFRQETIRIV